MLFMYIIMRMRGAPRPQAMRKRWSAIIRLHVSEGERIDPRGLGTQLYSAASPNQVIKINAYHLYTLSNLKMCFDLQILLRSRTLI